MRAQIKVEGLTELRRALKQAGADFPRRLRGANKVAAGIVAKDAKSKVPVLSGRLQKSIGVRASSSSAFVKAGTASRVPYARVIEFGWPGHNIEPQPYLYPALQEKEPQVIETYEDLVDAITRAAGFR